MTMFPYLIAESIRITHLPVEWGLFAWQFLSIFLLLLACWQLGRLAFGNPLAAWGGAALVASLLTIPVAGTALYIMDQYLTTRSLSAPAVVFLAVTFWRRNTCRAALWAVFTMVDPSPDGSVRCGFAASVLWIQWRPVKLVPAAQAAACLLFPLSMFPPVTGAYRDVLTTRSYFFLAQWAWYEWLGLLAPMAVLWWFQRIAQCEEFAGAEFAVPGITGVWNGIFSCLRRSYPAAATGALRRVTADALSSAALHRALYFSGRPCRPVRSAAPRLALVGAVCAFVRGYDLCPTAALSGDSAY